MGVKGRPAAAGVPRDVHVPVRLTKAEAARLDARRGGRSRSEYVRGLIAKDIREAGDGQGR